MRHWRRSDGEGEPEDAALRQFDVNVHGVQRGMKLVIPAMRERGRGHVVNIASAASKVAPAGPQRLRNLEQELVDLAVIPRLLADLAAEA
ncbi:SDR family NAD(P)-dependent oxidoreductase [Streptomyces bobili]|uniref:SDR family NAD(P)-dependent oxidoreductase n=1 Tax=Streptomyces bobili TaxID=67280 RepID=UPI0037ABCF79